MSTTETATKEHPILFSGDMVRAILAGRKTQTRRIVKPPKRWDADMNRAYADLLYGVTPGLHVPCNYKGEETWERLRNPWGWPQADWDLNAVPVHLWVRENLRQKSNGEFSNSPANTASTDWVYSADDARLSPNWVEMVGWSVHRHKPSMHMPRWASRITLEVTGVRVERLQDITEADAKAEGVEKLAALNSTYRAEFRRIWWDVYGAESWNANPWVWVVEFRRVKP